MSSKKNRGSYAVALVSLLVTNLAVAEATPGVAGGLSPFIPLLFIFAIFYFLILRPQQSKTKAHQKFLTELKRGDMVVTSSGIIGSLRTVGDKFVTLEVDEGVCLKILKQQVAENAKSLSEEKSKVAAGQLQEDRK